MTAQVGNPPSQYTVLGSGYYQISYINIYLVTLFSYEIMDLSQIRIKMYQIKLISSNEVTSCRSMHEYWV